MVQSADRIDLDDAAPVRGGDHNHNYCGSLWRVLAFGGGPGEGGDPNFGCWSVQLLCEPEEPADCEAAIPKEVCDE